MASSWENVGFLSLLGLHVLAFLAWWLEVEKERWREGWRTWCCRVRPFIGGIPFDVYLTAWLLYWSDSKWLDWSVDAIMGYSSSTVCQCLHSDDYPEPTHTNNQQIPKTLLLSQRRRR